MTREEKAALVQLCDELRQSAGKVENAVTKRVQEGALSTTCEMYAEECYGNAAALSDLVRLRLGARK